MKYRATLRTALAALALLPVLLSNLHAAPPDATTDYIDTTYTYNLGPTGARGWIYSTGNEWTFSPEGLTTESRQIKVTQIEAGSPADGVLQVDDVILGASGTAAAPVAFTSDARKAYGLAIGEAEKTANAGVLKLLVWRAGAVLPAPLQLTLEVMGSYSATAPYDCPKSTAIIQKACAFLEFHPINSSFNEGDAVIGLALLASVAPTDPTYATTQSKLQTYARSIAASNEHLTIPLDGMVAWPWGYQNVFLSEYYLATHDAAVLPAIRELTATCAKGQSLMGTYGHGMAWPKADGSSTHGYVPQYGAVNQAGETVNLGIMLGRKAIAEAGDATVDAEIDPAIERGRKYFGYFAGKGAVPYGHSAPEDLHDDNGKNGLAALLMAMQTQEDMSSQARYFAKSCTAAYSLREMGHAGPFYAHLWQPLGANVGGPTAMAAYFNAIKWEVDLVRRWDGSLAHHTSTGGTPGGPLGTDTDTASFLLTFATSLQRIYITGKGQSSSNFIDSGDITEAITDGVSSLRTDLNNLTTTSSDQLVGFLNSWSAQKRSWAAAALANRADAATKVPTLLTMAADLTNLNARKGACQALGQLKPAAAASVLRDRLTDSDYHVRYYAADALKNMGATAQPVLNDMLTTIVANQLPIEPIQWADPVQIAQSYLGSAAFEAQLGNSVAGVDTSLLYPAITAMAQGIGRTTLINTFENALSAADVQALAPVIITAVIDDHNICDDWLAKSCIRTLAKFNVDEGIPAAMIFANQENGRSWFAYGCTDSLNALQQYGAKAAATLPTLYYWNTNPDSQTKVGMVPGAFSATIAAIENDTASHTLLNFKTINSCSASSTTVNLPAGSTTLSATASDIDGHSAALVYSWSKVRGAGGVTFSANGTTASSNTIATFDTPGTYVIRLGVTDGVLDPNQYGPVTRDLTITVLADPNRPPVAANQNVTTPVNTAKAVTLAATDADGNTLTYSVVTNPASGTLTGTAPALTYTPATGFSGTTSFTYKANDGTLDSGIATVTITVGTSTNTTPVANNQLVATPEDTAVAITLTGTDADAGTTLTYAIVTQPAHGNLTGSGAGRTYTPATNFNGTDSFSFTVNDGTATSGLATVVIQVSAVNDAPVASAQSLTTPESTAIAITLAGSDPEGYAITYQVSGTPGHGTLTGTAPNLTYTPTTYYNGGDSLSFTVTDSEGVVSPAATVSITVTPVNQVPVALNRSLPVILNTATAIVLTGSDVDNDPLTYTVLSQPAHGTLTGTAPNLTYTPAAGYNSTDSFTFKVNDGTVDSANIATVYLSVGEVLPGIASEFFQNPPNLYTWPDMANLLPDDTRIDTQMSLSYGDFPAGYEDHYSSQHVAYLNITNGGNYGFSIGADDNSRVYVDETLVIQQAFPQTGNSAPIFLTPGYHGIRVEFVEGYGDNYFHLSWDGPGVSGNIPASSFFRWVGYAATPAPTNLAVLPGNTVASLSWSAVGRATSYNLKRSTTSGGPYTTIANLTDASHLDTGLINGTTYYYVVSSIGAQGEGVNSAEISVTPVASAALVTFTETNLNLNLLTNPTGAEILNDGTLVRAYHFGSASVITDITVHGVLFTKGGEAGSFTDTAMANWVGGYADWNGDWSLNSITDPDYRQLLNSMVMASSSSTITIGSLIAGHTYRLQLISNNPRQGQIRVEGNTYTLSGGDNANPVVLAAQWVAGDDTLNVSMLNNDMHFNAYALHDVTPSSLPSTTTLASSLGSAAVYGSAVTFTATVAVSGGAASGTVTFKDGADVLDVATLTSGLASFTTPALTVRGHSITASYSGDATVAPSTSSTFGYAVSPKPLTLTGVTAADKPYDGTTAANLTGGELVGVIGGDVVTVVAGTGTFASANPGTWSVTATGYVLGGTHAGNYVLASQPAVPNATILAAPIAIFTETSLNVAAGATGAEIQNDGTLVRAYHFGGNGITDITVNGVLFKNGGQAGAFADSAMTGTWDGGWGPGWGGFGATGDYGQLISAMVAAKHAGALGGAATTGTAVSTITLGGLTVGHTYRLQLISNSTRNAAVEIEGATYVAIHGDESPSWISATWVAGDDTLNVGWIGQSHSDGPHFCGYAVHELSPQNQAPVATAQSVTTAEDTAKAITLAGTDVEGSTLTYAIVAQPANGTLSGTAPNVTYTPAANYNGADSFTFKVNDGTVDSAPATVSITVTRGQRRAGGHRAERDHRGRHRPADHPGRHRCRKQRAHLHHRHPTRERHAQRHRAERDLHARGQLQRG